MKRKIVTTITLALLLISLIGSALRTAPPAESQLTVDEHTMALWHFDEGTGTTVYDSSPYANDGTVYGAKWATGEFGTALNFTTTDANVTVPDSDSLDFFGGTQFTIEFWTNLTQLQDGYWISKMTFPPPTNGYAILISTGILTTFFFDSDSAQHVVQCSLPPINQWVHIMITYGGQYLGVYFDDVLQNETDVGFHHIMMNNQPLLIGGRSLSGGQSIIGIIDEVRISDISRGPPRNLDLAVAPPDISFNPASPVPYGRPVTISANIHNYGLCWVKLGEKGDYIGYNFSLTENKWYQFNVTMRPRTTSQFNAAVKTQILNRSLEVKAEKLFTASIPTYWRTLESGVFPSLRTSLNVGRYILRVNLTAELLSYVLIDWIDLTVLKYDSEFGGEATVDVLHFEAEGYNSTTPDCSFGVNEIYPCNAVVRFFDGDPDAGGTKIGIDQTVGATNYVHDLGTSVKYIKNGGVGTAAVQLVDYSLVYHDIYVKVDPDNLIMEDDESNNKAFRRLMVSANLDLAVADTDISFNPSSPVHYGTSVTISADIHNYGLCWIRLDEKGDYVGYNFSLTGDKWYQFNVTMQWRANAEFATSVKAQVLNGSLQMKAEKEFAASTTYDWHTVESGAFPSSRANLRSGNYLLRVNLTGQLAKAVFIDWFNITVLKYDSEFGGTASVGILHFEAEGYNATTSDCSLGVNDIYPRDAVARFFDGDPSVGGTQIGADQTVGKMNYVHDLGKYVKYIENRGVSKVSVGWTAYPPSYHNIYAEVDPDDLIPEENEANNKAYKSLSVSAYLTISVSTGGTTSPPPGLNAFYGETVKVTAYPDAGYRFVYWELDGHFAFGNPVSVKMDEDHTLYADFVPLTQVYLPDNLRIQYYSNSATCFNALQTGAIDMMACPLDASQYAQAITDPNIVLGPVNMNEMFSFDLNCNETVATYPSINSPTSYVDFRRALAYLTDKNYITSNICGGFAGRMDVPIPANAPYWRNMSLIYPNYPWEYNPIDAATLLTGAGFVEGTTLNTYYDSGFPGSVRHIRVYPSYAVVHDNPKVDDLVGPPYSWTLTFTALSILRVMGMPGGQAIYRDLPYTFASNTVTVNVPLTASTYLWIEYKKVHPKAGLDLDPLVFYTRSDNPLMLAAGTLLAGCMRKAGIPVNLIAIGLAGVYDPVMGERDYHICMGYQLLDRYPTSMYELYHSSWWFPYGKNYVAPPCSTPSPGPSAIDPNYDIYLEDMYYASTIADAIPACQAAQSIHVMKVVNIPLWYTHSFYAWQSWVLGVTNEQGYGPINAYTFQKALKMGGANEPNVMRIGMPQSPRSHNILYAQMTYDYTLLDRYWEDGQAFNPYDINRDQPWIVQDWTPTTWVDPDDGGTKTACIYWLRKDVKWAEPVTGTYTRPFTAHDVEFSDMFSYYFDDGTHWNNVKDIDHIEIVDQYTFKVCFSSVSYWFQYAATYPLLPKNEWGGYFCTPTVYSEAGASYAAGDSLIINEGHGIAQIQTITVNGALFTNYWVRFNGTGGVYSANRIYFGSAVTGNLVISYWNITKSAKGYYPGSDTEWIPTSYICGQWIPTDLTKSVWAVFKRNSNFFIEAPSLGEIDWYWWWGNRDTTRPLGGPRMGKFVVDIYDVTYCTVSYGSTGYGNGLGPTTIPQWFPGADLAPSYTVLVPYGGEIDIYDVSTILVCYSLEFGKPPL